MIGKARKTSVGVSRPYLRRQAGVGGQARAAERRGNRRQQRVGSGVVMRKEQSEHGETTDRGYEKDEGRPKGPSVFFLLDDCRSAARHGIHLS